MKNESYIKIYKSPILLLFKIILLNLILDIISIVLMIIDYMNIKNNNIHGLFNTEEILFIIVLGLNILVSIYLFLRYINKYFILKGKKLTYYKGIIFKQKINISIENIGYTSYKQSIIGKIFNYGTIEISTQSNVLNFKGIDHPENLINLIGK